MAAMEVAAVDVLQLADRPWQEISTVRLPAATPPREACDVDDAPASGGCRFGPDSCRPRTEDACP